MGKCHLTKGRQALEIRSSLSEKRALTDPVQGAPCSAEALVRNLQWAKAHGKPKSVSCERVLFTLFLVYFAFVFEAGSLYVALAGLSYRPGWPQFT